MFTIFISEFLSWLYFCPHRNKVNERFAKICSNHIQFITFILLVSGAFLPDKKWTVPAFQNSFYDTAIYVFGVSYIYQILQHFIHKQSRLAHKLFINHFLHL